MKLLTKDILRRFPKIGGTDGKDSKEVKVIAKFFTPWTNWTWYAVEFDGEDTFFGFVDGHEGELGYFSLSELQSLRGPAGLKIERDKWFGFGVTLNDVKDPLRRSLL